MASQTTRNRRGKGKRKQYKDAVPGSRAERKSLLRTSKLAGVFRVNFVQRWLDDKGGSHRTRSAAVRASEDGFMPTIIRAVR